MNIAHANAKGLCGCVLQGDSGITQGWRYKIPSLLSEERPDNMVLGRSTATIVRMDQCSAVASPSLSLPYQFSSISKPYHYLTASLPMHLPPQHYLSARLPPSPFPQSLVCRCLSA